MRARVRENQAIKPVATPAAELHEVRFVERDGQQRIGLPSGVGKDRQHDAGNQPNGKTRGFEVGHLHDMHSNNLGALAKVEPVT